MLLVILLFVILLFIIGIHNARYIIKTYDKINLYIIVYVPT